MTLRPGLRVLGILVAATAFALAVTRVEDPDTWTHLALGRLMVESRGLPSHELLAFPSFALPYHDTEWLFDVVLYLTFRSTGLAGVVLLKSDLGFLYLYAGRADDAVRQQRAALALDPRLAQAHYGLGLALEKSGDGAGARRELAEYARLEPRSYLAWRLREERQTP